MKLLAFLLLLSTYTVFSQTYYMNIRMKGGGTTSIPIQDIQKLTFSNITDVGNERWSAVIKTFTLLQNYPNPFNPTTTIEYRLPKVGNVDIKIFDINGRLIKTFENTRHVEGTYKIIWDGKNNNGQVAASGVYFCQVAFENSILVRKMLFIK